MTPPERFAADQREIDAERGLGSRPGSGKAWSGPPPSKVSDAEYEKMSFAERATYASQHQAIADSQQGAGEAQGAGEGDGTAKPASVTVGEIEVSEDDLRAFLADRAARESGTLTAPARAEDYALTLPDNFQRPQGLTIDPAAPEVAQFREFALRNKLTQQQFSDGLGIYVAARLREQAEYSAALKRELDSCGANGPDRTHAVAVWLKAMVGDDRARPMVTTMVTRAQLEFERSNSALLLAGGCVPFSQSHQESPQVGISEEAYGRMSIGERLEYARSAGARAAR